MALVQPYRVRMAAAARQWSGYLRWRERLPYGPVVLVYHTVVDSLRSDYLDAYSIDWRTLRSHLRQFKRKSKIVPVGMLIEALMQGRQPDPRWIVITFDDALHSQTDIGADLLSSEGVPWAISVPAGLVGTERTVWTYEVRFLLNNLWSEPTIRSPLNTRETLPMGVNRTTTIGRIMTELLHSTGDDQRIAYIDELRGSVGSSTLVDAIGTDRRFVMANWADIARLGNGDVTVMSHGWIHRPHNATLTPEAFHEEVVKSKREIFDKTGRSPEGFVFPNGIADPSRRKQMQDAGYRYCFGTSAGRVDASSSLMCLSRIDGEYSLPTLRYHMLRTSV